ncbi:signal peptidase II [Denitratisoma sp. agr-D3]
MLELRKVLPWYALAALVVVLDQWSKAAIMGALQLGEGHPLTGFFNLVFVLNRGAAFSFLADAGGWQTGFFTLLALAVSGYIGQLLPRHHANKPLCTALALVMGGAIGNVIDRLSYGAVVDFLDFHVAGWHWPAFNVADSAICVGVVLILWLQLKENRK